MPLSEKDKVSAGEDQGWET
ncbi:hypothetical protein A2U01_0107914, partial [Trifolium medium]|nr:hypothetical protein [Trifolium medium]